MKSASCWRITKYRHIHQKSLKPTEFPSPSTPTTCSANPFRHPLVFYLLSNAAERAIIFIFIAGFAVNVNFLLSRPNASMPYKPGYEEDGFLKSLSPLNLTEIELMASNCTQVRVA
jgi:hypothetical protein